jgi:uncharacterized protein (TIGR03118 family)
MRRALRKAQQLGTRRPGIGGTGVSGAGIGAAGIEGTGIRMAGIGVAGAAISIAAAGLFAAKAPAHAADSFAQVNLIASSASYKARLTDPHLVNAWGLAAASTTPVWVSDNNSGFAGAYSGAVSGSTLFLDFNVPVPNGHPTGQVVNSDPTGFPVGGPSGYSASFIVDTDSNGAVPSTGQIEAWDGGTSFVVEDSTEGGAGGTVAAHAVFTGLTMAVGPEAGPELFAADVANGRIDVFNSDFQPVSTPLEFRDPKIPSGFVPFNVQAVGSRVYVTYAKQNQAKTGVLGGKSSGFVDVYTVNGQLIKHLVSGGPLDEPWGLAIGPKGFGPFAGYLLVGNQGNGEINAFNPSTGNYVGSLDTTGGKPVAITGLYALLVGNATFGGSSSLVFSAGPRGDRDGLVGILAPAKPVVAKGFG